MVELKSLETCLRQTRRKTFTYSEASPRRTNHTSVLPVPNQAPKALAAAGGPLGTKLDTFRAFPGPTQIGSCDNYYNGRRPLVNLKLNFKMAAGFGQPSAELAFDDEL
jgi:hypothetical protein